MYTMGVDIGSASSKVVILENGSRIVAQQIVPFGTGTSGPQRALNAALAQAETTPEEMSYIVATGYGRNQFALANKCVSEISCHAKGVKALVPTARTIVDIGGQDAKAILLDEAGRVEQFVMNDKCAAGTGRFLEVMARVLECELSQLAGYDARATEVVPVSSTCTVFAESEVISLLSAGAPRYNIIAGVHQSVAVKAASLVHRAGVCRDDVVMSGGVAHNAGVVRKLETALNTKVTVAPTPQSVGAYGAALYAYEAIYKRKVLR